MRPRNRGQALVEFALVAPILVVLLVALFDLGRAVFAYNSVTNAAREGARLGIVNQDTNSIKQRAIAQTSIAETQTPNVTINFYKPTAGGAPDTTDNTNSCTAVGCYVSVSFQTTFTPITPIIARIVFPNGVTLTAKSVELIENHCPTATVTAANCPRQP